ncbi:MAG: hypothetical protein RLZZ488_1524 [Pseudomonadota bacterium]|jgi:dihydropteroate synthase
MTTTSSGSGKCMNLLSNVRVAQMGILNLTPDSFSDGGRYCSAHSALEQALKLVTDGAHIIDVGAVSTRPGAEKVDVHTEWQRLRDALRELRRSLPKKTLISLDTYSPEVALRAADEGLIDIINDVAAAQIHTGAVGLDSVSGRETNWTTAHIAGRYDLGLILMHMQGNPQTMQISPHYDDCVGEICDFLRARLQFAKTQGVKWCAVDPGIGFGKTLEHNLSLLTEESLARLQELDAPVLIGLSRKSFLRKLAERTAEAEAFASPADEELWRDRQSLQWEQACIGWGARIIRTHAIKSFA